MNARQRLDEYLTELQLRLKLAVVTRAGAAIVAAIVFVTFAAIVWLAPLGFPSAGVIAIRIGLVTLVAAATVFLLWRPLRRLRASTKGKLLEERLPDQRGRIETYLDIQKRSEPSPFLDLLAEDALRLAKASPADEVVSNKRLGVAGGIAAAGVLVIVYALTVGGAQWGYGTRHLLLGTTLPVEAVPVKQIAVQPGDLVLRRNADLPVQAQVKGFKPENVELFVKFEDSQEWERAGMKADAEAGHYALTLYAVRAPVQYYAVADGVKSTEHTIKVVDVPRIDSMQLSYAYPQWTGLPKKVENEDRNIHAVADTRVSIEVKASEPLVDPVLIIDKKPSDMTAQATKSDGTLTVAKPARYHLASRVAGEMVALTDEYDITPINDEPPTIEIAKPGRDARASSIEEVPVNVNAKDDFNVAKVELRYAVNGGEFKTVKLGANSPNASSRTLLQMEELGGKTPLVPGDIVTYYAVAQDRGQKAETDLFMVQVQPFERRFSESAGGGGGGDGGGNEQQQIAERQKDLLMATWNLQRAREQGRRSDQQLQDSAKLLSEMQTTLAEQTTTLSERTRA
ncbi:MAG TPA: hypothetical protein VK629_06890, partial [Steroidobacteraceae bacterium]|nr:hypothetical protein [Steroidobacteraceae bacterium]